MMHDHEEDHIPHLVPHAPPRTLTRLETFCFGFMIGWIAFAWIADLLGVLHP